MIFEAFAFFALWCSHIPFHIKRLRHTLVVSFSPTKPKRRTRLCYISCEANQELRQVLSIGNRFDLRFGMTGRPSTSTPIKSPKEVGKQRERNSV